MTLPLLHISLLFCFSSPSPPFSFWLVNGSDFTVVLPQVTNDEVALPLPRDGHGRPQDCFQVSTCQWYPRLGYQRGSLWSGRFNMGLPIFWGKCCGRPVYISPSLTLATLLGPMVTAASSRDCNPYRCSALARFRLCDLPETSTQKRGTSAKY